MLQSKKIKNIIVYIFFHCIWSPLRDSKNIFVSKKSIFEHICYLKEASYGGYAKEVDKYV